MAHREGGRAAAPDPAPAFVKARIQGLRRAGLEFCLNIWIKNTPKICIHRSQVQFFYFRGLYPNPDPVNLGRKVK